MKNPLNIFKRNKETTDPKVIIDKCLRALSNRITDSFQEDGYHWSKPWGVKRFESVVLAKFFMEYSFKIISEDKLQDDERLAFDTLCTTSFSKLFDSEFSSVGLNYEDMNEDINSKIEMYFEARKSSKPPHCWHAIYQLVTKTENKEDIQEDIKNKTSGLELIRGNENFISMVPQYESKIKILRDKVLAFESAEMMLPHMARFTKDKLRLIKLKKIKALSKKMAKQEKTKK